VASVNPISALGAASLVVLAVVATGCQTTQDANRRIDVRFGRTLASREPLEFHGSAPDVKVVSTGVVDGKDSSAVVVVLRNTGDDPVNDLPIEVGIRGSRPLNTGANVPYFQSHAPAIAPGEVATWVYAAKDRLHGTAFARVGAPAKPALTTAGSVPTLEVSEPDRGAGKDGQVQVEVRNDTGIPQYDVDVYAAARRGGHYVAAGRGTVEHLGTGSAAQLTLRLIGDAKGTDVHVYAPPTLFE
jgi:hypothetical protein